MKLICAFIKMRMYPELLAFRAIDPPAVDAFWTELPTDERNEMSTRKAQVVSQINIESVNVDRYCHSVRSVMP